MNPGPQEGEARLRTLRFLSTPQLWPCWPMLPLVRRHQGREELGVLFDALHAVGVPGYSATVLLTNLFSLPPGLDQLLKLPREVYDTPEQVAEAGWRVD